MTVQQVSKLSGLSVDTIRYYERSGLITVEKEAYFKSYDQQTVDTLLAIKRLRLAGLSVKEIEWLLSIEIEATYLSQEQVDSISTLIDNAINRAQIRAQEIAESQQLLARMKNKLITVRHEDN